MSLEQVTSWVQQGESEALEFKETTGERREGVRALCGMLNHRGGRVLFGVVKAGSIVGQHVSDRTLEEIAQELKEIDPPIFPTVDRIEIGDGREVIAISVADP